MSTEQLLEEYLRVINNKDSEINRLIREVERLQLDIRKKEDRYRARLVGLKEEIDRFHQNSTATAQQRQHEQAEMIRLASENETLLADVTTLRNALQKSDDQLQGLLKASQKAQKHEAHAREKMEAEFNAVRRALEEKLYDTMRRSGQLESDLAVQDRRLQDGEKDATRWRAEAGKLQQEVNELGQLVKETKKRMKDLIPRDTVDMEISQLESRHSVVLSAIEKENNKLKDELRDECNRTARTEIALSDARRKCEELEKEIAMARRQAQDADLELSQAKLLHAQTMESYRRQFSEDLTSTTSLLERERSARSAAEGEVVVLKQRATDAELQTQKLQGRLEIMEDALRQEITSLKQRLHEALTEVETTRRSSRSAVEEMDKLKAAMDTTKADSRTEISRLRAEIAHADDIVARHVQTITHQERLLEESRAQILSLQSDLSAERSLALRREEEQRVQRVNVEERQRVADDEKRQLIDRYEEALRERESMFVNERSSKHRDFQKEKSAMSVQLQDMHEKVLASDRRCEELRNELTSLREQFSHQQDREKNFQSTIRAQDEQIVALQLEVSERDASITTLRRSLEQTSSSYRSAQVSLSDIAAQLEHEKKQVAHLERQISSLSETCSRKDEEVAELNKQAKRLEEAASRHALDLQNELQSMKNKVQTLTTELHASQQQLAVQKIELNRVEARHAEDSAALQRDLLVPLQQKVDLVVNSNQRLNRELKERDAQVEDLSRQNTRLTDTIAMLQADLSSKDRKVQQLTDDLEEQSQHTHLLRRTQQQLSSAQDELRRAKDDAAAMTRRIAQMEKQLEAQAKDIAELRDRELDNYAELNTRKAEVATWKEKCANLESLKNIADASVAEAGMRERDLLNKLDEMRQAQQMMQLCFDKQQEQLEIGRRIREEGSGRHR
jgi:chromosome segregation ATPase